MNRLLGSLLAVASVLCWIGPAAAQDWPNRAVRIVSGAGPAGTPTLTARILADAMSQTVGQQFIVDPRVGAAGNLAAELVAKSTPDGYTFLITTNGAHGIAPSLYSKLGFDAVKDFAGVAKLVEVPTYLFVSEGLKVKSVQEFVAYAKANPGKLNYATVGNGSFSHLATVLLEKSADIKLTHVPHKLTTDILPAIASGEIHVAFLNIRSAKGAIPLAIASLTRDEQLPVPTFTESGLKNVEVTQWYGIVAPVKTPQPVLERFSAEVQKLLRNQEVVKKLAGIPSIPSNLPTRAFESFYQGEIARWAVVVKGAGVTVD